MGVGAALEADAGSHVLHAGSRRPLVTLQRGSPQHRRRLGRRPRRSRWMRRGGTSAMGRGPRRRCSRSYSSRRWRVTGRAGAHWAADSWQRPELGDAHAPL